MRAKNYLRAYVSALRQYESDKRLLENLKTHNCWPYGRRLKGLPPDAIKSRELLTLRIRRLDRILRRSGEKVASALTAMDDRIGRQYIEMRYLQGLPMEEIAYIVGYSERQLYRRTRATEREFLRNLTLAKGVTRKSGNRPPHRYHITNRRECKEN